MSPMTERISHESRKAIADEVRRNCTLAWPLPEGIDATVYAVADWIENPPEWVTGHADKGVA